MVWLWCDRFVIDWDIGRLEAGRVKELNEQVSLIPGVVETGLFVGMADVAYFGQDDGSVKVRQRKTAKREHKGEKAATLMKGEEGKELREEASEQSREQSSASKASAALES